MTKLKDKNEFLPKVVQAIRMDWSNVKYIRTSSHTLNLQFLIESASYHSDHDILHAVSYVVGMSDWLRIQGNN